MCIVPIAVGAGNENSVTEPAAPSLTTTVPPVAAYEIVRAFNLLRFVPPTIVSVAEAATRSDFTSYCIDIINLL
jgi:hypothetical protein